MLVGERYIWLAHAHVAWLGRSQGGPAGCLCFHAKQSKVGQGRFSGPVTSSVLMRVTYRLTLYVTLRKVTISGPTAGQSVPIQQWQHHLAAPL